MAPLEQNLPVLVSGYTINVTISADCELYPTVSTHQRNHIDVAAAVHSSRKLHVQPSQHPTASNKLT